MPKRKNSKDADGDEVTPGISAQDVKELNDWYKKEEMRGSVIDREKMEQAKARFDADSQDFINKNRYLTSISGQPQQGEWDLVTALVSNPEVYKGSANDAAKVMKLMGQLRDEWVKFWADELK